IVAREVKPRSSARRAQSNRSGPGVPGIVLGKPIPIFIRYLPRRSVSEEPQPRPAHSGPGGTNTRRARGTISKWISETGPPLSPSQDIRRGSPTIAISTRRASRLTRRRPRHWRGGGAPPADLLG